ncbi:hypothetical protein SM12BL3_14200 [Serratia marcescens]|nr:hypothetical protein SM12BL3_14200 [Serratia marcescens]
MKERPVIFNGEMVRAILDGRKTQTRRVVSDRHLHLIDVASQVGECYPLESGIDHANSQSYYREHCPFGQVGDRLWGRETFADVNTDGGPAFTYRADHGLKFCLDDESPVDYDRYPGKNFAMWCSDLWNGEDGHSWSPSIHMPRWASRITLEITAVRVERLQNISEADAIAEGGTEHFNIDWFGPLWASIYGVDSWNANPWVWVIEFRRVGGA